MRTILATMAGVAFVFSAACSSTPGTATTSSGGGIGTTNGSPPTGGKGDNGMPCQKNDDCNSQICNDNIGEPGTPGLCCTSTCPAGDPHDVCTQPVGCNDAGACAYRPDKTPCVSTCVENNTEVSTNQCTNHICVGGPVTTCSPYSCTGTACNTACTGDGGQCAPDYYCVAGLCVQQTVNGRPCASDEECSSGVCSDVNNICCATRCPVSANDTTDCNANGCTYDAGSCEYPVGHQCVAEGTTNLCVDNNIIQGGQCNFTGFCVMDAGLCPNNAACDSKGDSCSGPCRVAADCATGFYCKNQSCIPQQADGGCSSDDQCLSAHCGTTVTGNSGHCCPDLGCTPADDAGICGASDCDGTTAACNYGAPTLDCGKPESCTVATQMDQPAQVCNGAGLCGTPAMVACAPFVCNATAGCFKTCTPANAATNCVANDICDPGASRCCPPLGKNPINVDSVNGVDAACCGYSGVKSCATITYAMKLIDSAQAANTVIVATVKATGGDWAPAGEVYPIVLGWGVEIKANGVAFLDPKAAGAEIFDIKAYDAADTLAYASIVGGVGDDVMIGFNQLNSVQTGDPSSILVESGATLYLANADVNGNVTKKTTAISIQGGGTLSLGGDAPIIGNTKNGTVTVGARVGGQPDGWNGIQCAAGSAAAPCTIGETAPFAAGSSLQIINQENIGLQADDFASITLSSSPTFGLPPIQPGFGECNLKDDGKGGTGYGILLDGPANVTLKGATIACIASPGIYLESTANGSPSLTLESSTVENTELGLSVAGGTATVTDTTFEFNYNGVEQSGNGTVNLNGGATAVNSVVCESNKESANKATAPGIGVNNASSNPLDASNTAWNTVAPDLFTCTGVPGVTTCGCDITTCTQAAGADDMDAVETSSGAINTANNTQSVIATNAACK